MPHGWRTEKPKGDDDYLERMSRAIFTAGLNWLMIEKKWPNFKRAFDNFSITSVSKFNEAKVNALMKNTGIVRNERKIRSVVANAQESGRLAKEFGSFSAYLGSFKGDEDRLIADLQERFRHLGESTARIFLYMAGVKLTPTREERAWMAQAKKKR